MIYFNNKTFEDVPGGLYWLHAQELLVYEKLKFEKRKKDWLLGRWAAKSLLATHFDKPIPKSQIEIRSNADRAPDIFLDDQLLLWTVSISHSHMKSLCALATPGIGIGCDLEKIERRSSSFIRDYFTINEKRYLEGIGELDQIEIINLLWSSKESVMKVLRTGLRVHPKKIELYKFENKGKTWQSIQMCHLATNKKFYGYWKIEKGFTFVIMSDTEFSLSKD